MTANPLDRIPPHDRLSLRAVIVPEGQDPGPALAAAGIVDPIALPVVFGENEPDVTFGDGFTPNLTAVLEMDQGQDEAGAPDHAHDSGSGGHDPARGAEDTGSGPQAGSGPAAMSAPEPGTASLPAAYGARPLAPVRRLG